MPRKRKDRWEVMSHEVMAARKSADRALAKLDAVIAMSDEDWSPGWVAGLYERRMDLCNTQVYLAGLLDAINQRR